MRNNGGRRPKGDRGAHGTLLLCCRSRRLHRRRGRSRSTCVRIEDGGEGRVGVLHETNSRCGVVFNFGLRGRWRGGAARGGAGRNADAGSEGGSCFGGERRARYTGNSRNSSRAAPNPRTHPRVTNGGRISKARYKRTQRTLVLERYKGLGPCEGQWARAVFIPHSTQALGRCCFSCR